MKMSSRVSTTAWKPKDLNFKKKFEIEFWCWRAEINIQVDLNMHIYDVAPLRVDI